MWTVLKFVSPFPPSWFYYHDDVKKVFVSLFWYLQLKLSMTRHKRQRSEDREKKSKKSRQHKRLKKSRHEKHKHKKHQGSRRREDKQSKRSGLPEGFSIVDDQSDTSSSPSPAPPSSQLTSPSSSSSLGDTVPPSQQGAVAGPCLPPHFETGSCGRSLPRSQDSQTSSCGSPPPAAQAAGTVYGPCLPATREPKVEEEKESILLYASIGPPPPSQNSQSWLAASADAVSKAELELEPEREHQQATTKRRKIGPSLDLLQHDSGLYIVFISKC